MQLWFENVVRQKRSQPAQLLKANNETEDKQQNRILDFQFRKMRHKVNLRNEFQPSLDFSTAPQNVVFHCSDGEVILFSLRPVSSISLV